MWPVLRNKHPGGAIRLVYNGVNILLILSSPLNFPFFDGIERKSLKCTENITVDKRTRSGVTRSEKYFSTIMECQLFSSATNSNENVEGSTKVADGESKGQLNVNLH